jgi:hypothetical protein
MDGEGHLPRRGIGHVLQRAGHFRHDLALSDRQLDPPLPADAFALERAAKTVGIEFANPAVAAKQSSAQ